MPIWSFYCSTCDSTTDRMFSSYAASTNAACLRCGTTLERQPAVGSFVVVGYNAKNLYSNKN